MKLLAIFILCLVLASCSKPELTQDYPTKYPETPTNGSWEEFKP
jgi:hypothetical protein